MTHDPSDARGRGDTTTGVEPGSGPGFHGVRTGQTPFQQPMPRTIDVDDMEPTDDHTYLRGPGARTLPDPADPERTVEFHTVRRGNFSVGFAALDATDDGAALADRLCREYPHLDRLSAEEFRDLLTNAPDYRYLRVADPRLADRLAHEYGDVEAVEAADAPEVTGP